ncbi:MAG: 5'-methylthioadenosine/adenosylhomocysteine nucleosidase [Muribaculaceae bacterium]|nr:5'-methylthioadenosine/adenosylhomocysteine nucleosidase [Muribaculaceae bacterium]
MNVGIIVAMDSELQLLLPLIEECEQLTIDGLVFYQGYMTGRQVVAMKCGIGKVNATVGTVTLIDYFRPDYIISTGVAGGADLDVNVMDIVVGSSVAYHDVWCGPGLPWGLVQGMPQTYQANEKLLSCVPNRADVKRGLICTGDCFIDSKERVADIKRIYPDALAVDMESAAIAQTCLLRETSFMSLRIISDSPGASDNNSQQYTDFWKEAPEHTFDTLCDLLKNLEDDSDVDE